MKISLSLMLMLSLGASIHCAEVGQLQKRYGCTGCDFTTAVKSSHADHRSKIRKGQHRQCTTCGKRAYQSPVHTAKYHDNLRKKYTISLIYYCYYCIAAPKTNTNNHSLYATTHDKTAFDNSDDLREHVDSSHFKIHPETSIFMPIHGDVRYWNYRNHTRKDLTDEDES